jgi:hypothetical protein
MAKKEGGWYTLKMTVLCSIAGIGLYFAIDFRASEVRRLNSQLEETTRLLNETKVALEGEKISLKEQRAILDRARAILEPIIQADMAACRNEEGGEVISRLEPSTGGWFRVRKLISLMEAPQLCVIEEGAE